MTKPKNPKILVPMVGPNPTQMKSLGVPKGYKHVPRERHEHEALPITFKTSEVIDLPVMTLPRPCSNKEIKSRGVSC